MLSKSKNNKKAVIGNTLAMIFATILLVIILITFIVVSKVVNPLAKMQKETLSYKDEKSASYSLENYLQTPIKIDINGKQKEVFVKDLLEYSEKDANIKAKLDQETAKMFSIFKNCYELYQGQEAREGYAKILVPFSDKISTIQLKIDTECLKG